MKPVFCESDYQKLRQIVEAAVSSPHARDAMMLSRELGRAKVVKDGKINDKTIRIGSTVKVKDMNGGKMHVEIVLPSQANLAEKKISVLAPLAIALLGFSEKDVIDWELPAGKKKLTVEKVLNARVLEK